MKKLQFGKSDVRKYFEIKTDEGIFGYATRSTENNVVEAVCIQTAEQRTFTHEELIEFGIVGTRISQESLEETGIAKILAGKLDSTRDEAPALGCFVNGRFGIVSRVNLGKGFIGYTELIVNDNVPEGAKSSFKVMFRQVDIADIVNGKVDFSIAEPGKLLGIDTGSPRKFFTLRQDDQEFSYGFRCITDSGQIECLCVESCSIVLLDPKTLQEAGLLSYHVSNLEDTLGRILNGRKDTDRDEEPKFGIFVQEGSRTFPAIINRVNLTKGFVGITELILNEKDVNGPKGPFLPIFKQVSFADIANGKVSVSMAC